MHCYGATASRLARGLLNGLLMGMLLVLLPGCGGSGGDDDEYEVETTVFDATPSGGILEFVNAIPDSPTLFFHYVASWDGSSATANLEFGTGSTTAATASGYDVTVGYEKPNGEIVVLFEFLQDEGDTDIEVAVEDEASLVVSGTLAEPTWLLIENEEYRYGLELPEDDEVLTVDPEVLFVHAVVGQGALDFYLTQAPVALTTVAPLATLSFMEHAPPIPVEPRDDYRLRVTPVGDPETVLFDSGTFTLTSNVRTRYPAVNYLGPGDNEIQVISRGVLFPEVDLPTAIRFANLVADVTAFDVYFGDTAEQAVFSSVGFQTLTSYLERDGGTEAVNVTPNGIDNEFVYQGSHELVAGATQTLYVTGVLNSLEDDEEDVVTVMGTLVTDDVRPVASEIRVRVVQGAASLDLLDVYVLGPGQTSDDVSATFGSLALGGSEVGSFDPGDYDVLIINPANGSEMFGPERVSLTSGKLYSVVISETAGGGVPLDVELLSTEVVF